MRITPLVQRQVEEEEKLLQSKESSGQSPEVTQNIESRINAIKGGGQPLPYSARAYFEPRFGVDFSQVRVISGPQAAESASSINALAYTLGNNVVFGAGQYQPNTIQGKQLLAHELAHVIQQGSGAAQRTKKMGMATSGNIDTSIQQTNAAHRESKEKDRGAFHANAPVQIQRRLIVSGSTEALVNEYLTLVGTAARLRLNWAFRQPRVTVGGNLPGAVPSPAARSNILRVINHATQHAELHIGTNQPRVSVGAFPGAGSTIQTIDMDDIRNLNASLPGQGTAKAFHEMMENFNAHGIGFGNFAASHAVGLEEESNVLEEQGIVGRRLGGGIPATVIPAPAGQPAGPNIAYLRQLQNFTHYFLEIIQRRTTGSPTGPGADFEVVSARRIPKIQVSHRTIDHFVSGSNATPPAGIAILAVALADLNANPNSTLLIEGFADNVGSEAANRVFSRNRAATAQAFFIANGIAANRIAIVGRGETNFVATNANEAGRSQNRRIELTVHRP